MTNAVGDGKVDTAMTTRVIEKPAPVDALHARAEVDRLFAIEKNKTVERKAQAAELARIEFDRGDRILDANGDGAALAISLGSDVASLRVAIETSDSTIAAARRQRAAAIPYVWRAEAAQIEREADEIAAEAAAHGKRPAEIIAELAELEGVPYVPAYHVQLARRLATPGTARDPITLKRPTTEILQAQAAAKRAEAQVPLGRVVNRNGMVEVQCPPHEPTELLELAIADPMRLAPPILELEAWIERTAAAEAKQRAQLEYEGAETILARPTIYRMLWRDERIVESESGARPAHLDSENVRTGERTWSWDLSPTRSRY